MPTLFIVIPHQITIKFRRSCHTYPLDLQTFHVEHPRGGVFIIKIDQNPSCPLFHKKSVFERVAITSITFGKQRSDVRDLGYTNRTHNDFIIKIKHKNYFHFFNIF